MTPNTDISVSSLTISTTDVLSVAASSAIQQPNIPVREIVDASVSTAINDHTGPGPIVVWTDDQTGCVGFVASNDTLAYRKTLDGEILGTGAITINGSTDMEAVST